MSTDHTTVRFGPVTVPAGETKELKLGVKAESDHAMINEMTNIWSMGGSQPSVDTTVMSDKETLRVILQFTEETGRFHAVVTGKIWGAIDDDGPDSVNGIY